jgi:hypothetical protein
MNTLNFIKLINSLPPPVSHIKVTLSEFVLHISPEKKDSSGG